MTRKYRLKRTAFIGCRNTAYMDIDDAEPSLLAVAGR